MENTRERNGKTKPSLNQKNIHHIVRENLLLGFEGMNFEQQRGSYINNDDEKEPAGDLRMRYLKSKVRTSN